MVATVLTTPGAQPPSACFSYVEDYPRPSLPSQDWIFCRAHAAGLNRAELRGRDGHPPVMQEFNIFQAAVMEVNDCLPLEPTENGMKRNLISRLTSPPRAKTSGQQACSGTDANSSVLPSEYEIIDYVDKFFSSTGQLSHKDCKS